MDHNEMAEEAMRSSENGNFAGFFDQWLAGQDRLLQLLLAAAAASDDGAAVDSRSPGQNGDGDDLRRREQKVRPLVDQVLGHYEQYYRVKRAYARRDAAAMFDPRWRSSAEKMFMWIWGWRPSMAIQLLYSMSGIQLQHRLDDVLRGVPTGDLADLSADQIARVNELHRKTVRKEREVTEEAAQAQETVVGSDVVELSHVLTETKEVVGEEDRESRGRRMEAEMAPRKEMMEKVLERADALRLETLKSVAGILKPLQAVHFLIAAAEVHEWGTTMDDTGRTGTEPVN